MVIKVQKVRKEKASTHSSGMHAVLSASFHWTCLYVGDPGDDGTDGNPGGDGRDGNPGPKGRQLNFPPKLSINSNRSRE